MGLSIDGWSREAHRTERHKDKLPTTESRVQYASKMAEALQQASFALSALAAELEADPDCFLLQAYEPNIMSSRDDDFKKVEITCVPRGVAVKCTAQGPRPFQQIAFRAVKLDSDPAFRSTMDDAM